MNATSSHHEMPCNVGTVLNSQEISRSFFNQEGFHKVFAVPNIRVQRMISVVMSCI